MWIFITDRHVAWTDCIFWSCDFQRGPYWGCWWGGFSSHTVFTRPLARLASVLCCLFLQGVSQHLLYLVLMASQSCMIWTVAQGIHSDLEGTLFLLMFPTFHRRIWRGQRIFYRAIWSLFRPLRHTRGYLLLSPGLISLGIYSLLSLSGLWPSDRLFGGASWRLLIPKFSLIIGVFRSSRKDCFTIASKVLGGLIPAFYCSSFETNNILSGLFYSLRQDFWCSHILLMLCEEER